jgi:hypothetical protein
MTENTFHLHTSGILQSLQCQQLVVDLKRSREKGLSNANTIKK